VGLSERIFWKNAQTKVAEFLKATVNQGAGTNSWRTFNFVNMLHLPKHMSRLDGSTGGLHVGFAGRGLKSGEEACLDRSNASVLQAGKGQWLTTLSCRWRRTNSFHQAKKTMTVPVQIMQGWAGLVVAALKLDGMRHPMFRERQPHAHGWIQGMGHTKVKMTFRSPILHCLKKKGRFDQIFEVRTKVASAGACCIEHTQTAETKDHGVIAQMLNSDLQHFLIVKHLLRFTKSTQPNCWPSNVSFLKLSSRFWFTAGDSRKWRLVCAHDGHS
jgi:hypothetical protein